MNAKINVTIDGENNAEQWWDALRAHAQGQKIEAAIDAGSLTAAQLRLCESLPGWSDGPAHAPTALVVEAVSR